MVEGRRRNGRGRSDRPLDALEPAHRLLGPAGGEIGANAGHDEGHQQLALSLHHGLRERCFTFAQGCCGITGEQQMLSQSPSRRKDHLQPTGLQPEGERGVEVRAGDGRLATTHRHVAQGPVRDRGSPSVTVVGKRLLTDPQPSWSRMMPYARSCRIDSPA